MNVRRIEGFELVRLVHCVGQAGSQAQSSVLKVWSWENGSIKGGSRCVAEKTREILHVWLVGKVTHCAKYLEGAVCQW